MPATLTLKNIPDAVYDRLKRTAEANRRTVCGQALFFLESAVGAQRPPPSETLERARELRSELPAGQFPFDEIDAAKRAGRS